MATSRQIKCITKKDSRITHVGGDWGPGNTRVIITEEQAIKDINQGNYAYHVKVGFDDVKVIVAGPVGHEYLKTKSDDTTKDNLLSLPGC